MLCAVMLCTTRVVAVVHVNRQLQACRCLASKPASYSASNAQQRLLQSVYFVLQLYLRVDPGLCARCTAHCFFVKINFFKDKTGNATVLL
jgi:hypothetical protein